MVFIQRYSSICFSVFCFGEFCLSKKTGFNFKNLFNGGSEYNFGSKYLGEFVPAVLAYLSIASPSSPVF